MKNTFIRQAVKLCGITLLGLPQRIPGSFVAIFSIACVTAVLLTVLTLIHGMNKTMEKSGWDSTLIAMRAGSSSELQSVLFPIEVNNMLNHPKVIRDENDRPLFSSEMFVNAEAILPEKTGDRSSLSLALRGVSGDARQMRPHFKLVAGRHFESGLREVVVGQGIVRKHPGVEVGRTIKLGGSEWLVAGIFADNFSVFESEVWADLNTVQNDYQRGNSIQSVRIAFAADVDIEQVRQQWKDDPRLNVQVLSENAYFSKQSESVTRLMRWLGIPLALIMAMGAVVAALNTMYSAIAGRKKEIAVHKAIGFNPASIALSIVFESILLAMIGGVIGILPLYLGLNEVTAATNNAANLSQIMFNFSISPLLMVQALLIAVSIGLLGGILPAIHTIRIPVSLAIRGD
ncbi:ABC transporter permease [Microbulbifer sp. 2304DJ12-6]|uniref:ABC transporter permease n=1 Tax=Microbulbifer sp. 2304DJ12-6 TaxID=3233340 RepID=UPI0039B0E989